MAAEYILSFTDSAWYVANKKSISDALHNLKTFKVINQMNIN